MIPRLLRSRRLFVAAGVLLVFGVLLVLAHHRAGVSGSAQPTVHVTSATATTGPTVTPSGPVEPSDEGVASDPSPSPARITASEVDPKAFAIGFFTTYMNTQGKRPDEWRATWRDMVTPELADLLADTDPSMVVSARIHDADVKVIAEGDALVTVTIPVPNEGVATLTLTGGSRQWLVSQLDWEKIR